MSASPVRILGEHESVAIPESLAASIGFVGLDSWTMFVKKMYGFSVFRIVSESDNEIDGWLALVRVRHIAFGDYLTSSPFGSYGGFACSSIAARDALLEKARGLANDLAVDHVNVRFEAGGETPPEGWIQHPIYATYRATLLPDPAQLMSGYGSDHRNHIRKALKKGFSIRFGHLDLLADVYAGIARSMHELGSPYHSRSYLRAMAESLGDALEFVVMYDKRDTIAGAGVFIFQGDMVTNLHANILRRFRSDYAGEFLYWSVIERYCRLGLKLFDLGRSLIGSGNETFKLKWKPRKVPLAYWYYLPRGGRVPELNQKSARFQFAMRMWRRLPAFVVRVLGPVLIRGIA